MKQATLCILLTEGKVLLAMKKRGFGVGKWNGAGGKVKEGETVRQAAVRELCEEIGVHVLDADLCQVGTINFSFEQKPEWEQKVFIFTVKKWEGEPIESEEMRPQWFRVEEIPYEAMWKDDRFWLPLVLEDKKIRGFFHFSNDGEAILQQKLEVVESV